MQLVFATHNANKLSEAKEILGIDIVGTSLEIPEIQSLDPIEVATHKAKSYFSVVQQPLFVEDVSLVFNALNGLPGPYISDFSQALGTPGLIKLLAGYSDRGCTAIATLGYCESPDQVQIFQGQVTGTVSTEVLGENGFGWDQLFIPKGSTKTFAQMTSDEKNSLSHRNLALQKLQSWLASNSRNSG